MLQTQKVLQSVVLPGPQGLEHDFRLLPVAAPHIFANLIKTCEGCSSSCYC